MPSPLCIDPDTLPPEVVKGGGAQAQDTRASIFMAIYCEYTKSALRKRHKLIVILSLLCPPPKSIVR